MNSKVIDCLNEVQKAADCAIEMQKLMHNIISWQPKLMALVGERAQLQTKPEGMHFEKKYNQELGRDEYKLKSINSGIELQVIGDKKEFQRIACEILAACPLL